MLKTYNHKPKYNQIRYRLQHIAINSKATVCTLPALKNINQAGCPFFLRHTPLFYTNYFFGRGCTSSNRPSYYINYRYKCAKCKTWPYWFCWFNQWSPTSISTTFPSL